MAHSNYRNKILLVEDNEATLHLLKRILEDEFTLISATDGSEAMQILKDQDPPDLILSDIMMPKMSGYGLFNEIQMIPRLSLIPVIFVTSLSSSADELIGLEIGAVDYITKPIERKTLLARINNILEMCQYRRDLDTRLPESPSELFPDETIDAEEIEENVPVSNDQLPQIMVASPDNKKTQYQLIEKTLIAEYELKQCAQLTELKTCFEGEYKPDLILLDLDHLKENRFDVLKAFRQEVQIQHIPIILLTSITCTDDERKALESGCNDYIIKPIIPNILKARIRIHVELSRHHQSFENQLEAFLESE